MISSALDDSTLAMLTERAVEWVAGALQVGYGVIQESVRAPKRRRLDSDQTAVGTEE